MLGFAALELEGEQWLEQSPDPFPPALRLWEVSGF